MPKANELEWGLKSNLEAPALWGARMYVERWEARIAQTNPRARGPRTQTRRQLAILPDRKSLLGEEPARGQLVAELDRETGGVIDELRSMAARGELDDDRDFAFTLGAVETHVRIAGGYVYVTCALVGCTEKPKDVSAVYDNGGAADRYTCVLTWKESGNRRSMIALSGAPTHPQGISTFTSGIVGKHLGKRLRWEEVPEHIRKHIAARLAPEEG